MKDTSSNEASSSSLEASDGLVRQRRTFSWLFSKNVPPIAADSERRPYFSKNLLSISTYWWCVPVLRVGYKRTIVPADLPYLTDDLKVEEMYQKFIKLFNEGNERARAAHIAQKCTDRNELPSETSVDPAEDLLDYQTPPMVTVKAILSTLWLDFLLSNFFCVLGDVGACCLPLVTRQLINFVTQTNLGLHPPIGKGIGYAIGAAIMIFVFNNFLTYFMYYSTMSGAKTKAILTKALLEKSFKADARTKHQHPTGVVTAFMSTDMAKIDQALIFLPFGLMFIFPLVAAIVIMAINIGVPTAVGFGVLLFAGFIMAIIGGFMFKFRLIALKFADERIGYIKEVVNNLKIIKFYSWEIPYFNTISKTRGHESNALLGMQYNLSLIFALSFSLTNFASMVAFLMLWAIGGTRSPARIFSSISLFEVLSNVVTMLPLTIGSAIPAYISLKRVGNYLGCPESSIDENVDFHPDSLPGDDDKDQTVICAQDASFIWESFEDVPVLDAMDGEKPSDKPTKGQTPPVDVKVGDEEKDLNKIKFSGLDNLDFSIQKGELIIVLGSIGTGKSSLLNALSGFMTKTAGSVSVNGSLLLCGTPWVQNATLKENILFGKPLSQSKYDKIVEACSLNSDIDLLPAGDKTEIGERGINLSGGQKARLSLARAVYAEKDIILMDDVLSAVDARVGKHIMQECIQGYLKNKTRILATHQLPFVLLADRIMFLNGDGTLDFGTYEELKSRNARFNQLLSHSDLSRQDDDEEEEKNVTVVPHEEEKRELQKQVTVHSVSDNELIREGKLIEDESRAVNAIGLDVYKSYVKLGSKRFNPLVLFFFYVLTMALAIFCNLFTNTWLSFWLDEKYPMKDGVYIGIYIMFTFLSYIFLVLHLVITAYVVINASGNLNILSTKQILQVPMSYMDVTPIGRILNRFTKDTDSLDNEIISQLILVVFALFFIAGVLILCIIYLPWFAIAIPPLGFVFFFVANYYQASSREIKRLEAIQRSFVYNNFNECLTGSDVIKAYNDTDRFMVKNDRYINNMNEAYFMVNAVQRWLSIFLGAVAFCFVLIVTLLSVNKVFNISAASAGLVVSYVLSMPGLSTLMLRSYTLLENEMNSVERMSEFAFRLPQEKAYHITETTPPSDWPSRGEIEFDNVSVAYRPGLPNVLKNITLEVKSGERVGICGRTGAGKSSMTNVLYRILELTEGSVKIDGIDIATLGMNELRSKLSIIPQEAVLFRGNIRKNLDPFEALPDEKLWEALRRAGLIESHRLAHVTAQKKGVDDLDKFHLEATVEDDGTNFSLGERQLIAFARALARDSKILVLDEATSSVDFETDSKIQKTIATEFTDCTIMCIAHRLKTIINYDKILVLDQGEVREFEEPWALYQKTDSIFRSLCDKSKILPSDFDVNH